MDKIVKNRFIKKRMASPLVGVLIALFSALVLAVTECWRVCPVFTDLRSEE